MEDDLVGKHDRCFNCQYYMRECLPPHVVDAFDCKHFSKKREGLQPYNPTRRDHNEHTIGKI
jgi:hypothetical protein